MPVSSKKEMRSGTAELRNGNTFFGRAVVYDTPSTPICGLFTERFAPGAFDAWLANAPDIYACVEHDPSRLLARTSSKTLRITSGSGGLDIEGDLPNTTYANDLREQLTRGDMRGMSFIFVATKDEWRDYNEDGKKKSALRIVYEAELYEVSFVTNPAYPATTAGLRSADDFAAEIERVTKPTYPLRSVWSARVRINERK